MQNSHNRYTALHEMHAICIHATSVIYSIISCKPLQHISCITIKLTCYLPRCKRPFFKRLYHSITAIGVPKAYRRSSIEPAATIPHTYRSLLVRHNLRSHRHIARVLVSACYEAWDIQLALYFVVYFYIYFGVYSHYGHILVVF